MRKSKENFLTEYHRFLKKRLTLFPQHQAFMNEENREKIGEYFFLLYVANQAQNLTGYRTVEEYVDYHLLDTLFLMAEVERIKQELKDIPDSPLLLDVGSGAGVPGVIIQILNPEMEVHLLDTTKKKTDFLQSIMEQLELSKLKVWNGRAEDLAHEPLLREQFDIVTARALGPLTHTLELTVAFAKPAGRIVLPRGASEVTSEQEREWLHQHHRLENLLAFHFESESEYRLPERDKDFFILSFSKSGITPDKYPRKPGQIKKRPL